MTNDMAVDLGAPIGVFDSGVGGLSVMLTIRRLAAASSGSVWRVFFEIDHQRGSRQPG
jgi:hypothetical protein